MSHTEKPTATVRKSVKAAILADLRRAYPRGRSTIDLIQDHGTCAKSRLNELKSDGWDIGTGEVDGSPGYMLLSLSRGEEEQVVAGCTIRLGSRTGWTSRTHREATQVGTIPEAVLQRAEQAATQAYRSVVDQWCPVKVEDPVDDVMAFFLEDM